MAAGFFAGIVDLLFPPRCVFCRGLLKSGEREICARCRRDLPLTEGAEGLRQGEFFEECVAPLQYTGIVRESLLRYKFQGFNQYASCYGKLLADCIRERLSGTYDLISWVPLSRDRLKRRGYDQAMLLAMAAALELDDVALETLKKVLEVPAQSGLEHAEERRANVLGAYEVPDPELIRGKRILLIDDIVTTGSTLSECARTLLEAGAEKVYCAAVACTPPQKEREESFAQR